MLELRPVEPGDVDVYERLRCDPRMMAELGGPQDVADMPGKVEQDVAAMAADSSWVLMILPDAADRSVVGGTVTLWSSDDDSVSEIGWMVLPDFQGRGLASSAVAEVLRRAAEDGRWNTVHAYPAVTNAASNRLCRRTGFTLTGPHEKLFRGRTFRTNDWLIDPGRVRRS